MDMTPELHFLQSQQNSRLGWHDCLSELIDNSFDAGATNAVLCWSGRMFRISDDGKGIPQINDAVRLGGRKSHKTTALGRYGVGLKDAWLWLSNDLVIKTTHNGTTTILTTGVSKIVQTNGKWEGPDPESRPASDDERGTVITFGTLKANRAKPERETIERLGLTFMPALMSGKQIAIQSGNSKKPVRPFRLPAMQEAIEESFEVGGRVVTIHIGIAQEGEKISEPGFLICYGHRVIKVSSIGTGAYSAGRLVGTISLGHGWELTPHKNDFAEQCDALDAEIFTRIRPMLEKAEQLSETLESNEIRAELEALVNTALADAGIREKRQRGESHGTRTPKLSGAKRQHAEKTDPSKPGSVIDPTAGGSSRKRGLTIKWGAMASDMLGRCDREAKAVVLNIENEFMARMKRTRNQPAMFAVVIGLWCYMEDTTDGPQMRAIAKGTFETAWGCVMSSLAFEEKANAVS